MDLSTIQVVSGGIALASLFVFAICFLAIKNDLLDSMGCIILVLLCGACFGLTLGSGVFALGFVQTFSFLQILIGGMGIGFAPLMTGLCVWMMVSDTFSDLGCLVLGMGIPSLIGFLVCLGIFLVSLI